MSKKYTAAIVGCGGIGNSHMEGYNRVDNVEVVAVADPLEPARRQYMEDYGIPQGYATVEEMVQKAQPDIVSVCAWHLLHAPLTIAAAQPGVKGIICEKPMTVSMGDANRMVEACDASGTKLVISHQRRFTPGWEKARELMEQKVIGHPLSVNCNVREGLLNWGTHAIDGSRFVLGDPQVLWVMGAVERRTDRHERDTPIEDSCMGLVHMEGDLQLFIQSDLYKEPARSGGFLIRGTEGMLDVSEAYVSLFNATSNGWQDIPLRVEPEKIQPIGGDTNAAQVRELIAWIEGGPEHRGSGYKARATVEIMMAIYESARRHHVIHLPSQEEKYPLGLMIDSGQLPVEEPGRYDIRGFLKRDEIDEEDYERLRRQGMRHGQIMRTLHKVQ
ncbi:MAG: Gfo/Idh/MocA family oxidoreductase [Candidatus Poribacteria bacterium]|nr:Gfo/Idh/MocA family oxidoreductase [Candidatus Poribacteria bacterium]